MGKKFDSATDHLIRQKYLSSELLIKHLCCSTVYWNNNKNGLTKKNITGHVSINRSKYFHIKKVKNQKSDDQ